MTGVCGRPTIRGTPCHRPLLWYETACTVHATPTELDQATERLRAALAEQLAHEQCECRCHMVTHPGVLQCPRCTP